MRRSQAWKNLRSLPLHRRLDHTNQRTAWSLAPVLIDSNPATALLQFIAFAELVELELYVFDTLGL
jgi:hypothetical protein